MSFTIPNEADAYHKHQAQVDNVDFDILVQGHVGNGIIGADASCKVTAQGTPDTTVAVAAGTIQIDEVQVSITGGNVTCNDDASLPRFYLILAKDDGTISAKAGTPAANPVFPELDTNTVALAAVLVEAGDNTIATNKIVDKRVFPHVFHSSDEIVDADGDTKIQVEESGDEDIIRFDVKANETLLMGSTGGAGNGSGAVHQMHFPMQADQDILIDGATNPRTIDTGVLRFEQKPSIENTRAITVNLDVNSQPNSNALVLNMRATQIAAGERINALAINIIKANSSGGVAHAIQMSLIGTGGVTAEAIHVNPNVAVLRQSSGSFVNVEKAWEFTSGPTWTDDTAAFNSDSTDVEIFTLENDIIYIGMAAVFDHIEVILATPASGAGIKPAFAFSDGIGGFTDFIPEDATQGMRQDGIIEWNSDNISAWAQDTVNGTSGKYWIRITRTQVALTTPPIEDTIQVQAVTEYSWDKDGDVSIRKLDVGGSIVVEGTLDEDNMASDSAVKLATQQSIKAYVDASGGAGHTIEDEGTPLTTRTKLNFVGAGVEVTDDAGDDASDVTIPGPGESVATYTWYVPGEITSAGTHIGTYHSTGPSAETVKRISINVKTPAQGAGADLQISLYHNASDDLDDDNWILIDTPTAHTTNKGVIETSFTVSTIPAQKLIRMDIVSTGGATNKASDLTVIMTTWRPLQT